MTPIKDYGGNSSIENSPDHFYRNARQSLRPLPQAPNTASPPNAKRKSSYHARAATIDRFPQTRSEDPFIANPPQQDASSPVSARPVLHHAVTTPQQATFRAPDYEELQKSSTSHLRALSKFTREAESQDYAMTGPAPSVVGLMNRRQLKRADSTVGPSRMNKYGFERNWMDKQRQFLQAYEYLCHIGEAKEWIEDVIHKPIPPIVELEEALRNGITLAELVQVFYPQQQLKIVRDPKLKFKYTDNIVLFFRFCEEIGLPELFRFELIDLYEKKNIPKVIYCIHALSWLLYRKGMVDFRIGNLVGQLEFEHHELEQTQRGLDKAGISMPSFAGMGASFGAEPEPEPVETEEERIDRELHEREGSVVELQSQLRGALVRIRLGDTMQDLWDNEDLLTDLQSRIRGDWARQVIDYRLNMKRFSTSLQAVARGFLARSNQQRKEQLWRAREKHIVKLQNLIRGRRARAETRNIKTSAKKHIEGIKAFQAAVRGALARRDLFDQQDAAKETESDVRRLQAVARGMLLRRRLQKERDLLQQQGSRIGRAQGLIRGLLARQHLSKQQQSLEKFEAHWSDIQSAVRGQVVRQEFANLKRELRSHQQSIAQVQAGIRGANAREEYNSLQLALLRQSTATIPLQSKLRGFLLRKRLLQQRKALEKHLASILRLQAAGRGALQRGQVGETLAALEEHVEQIIDFQSVSRAMLCRQRIGALLAELDEHDDSVTELQALIRAGIVRQRFAEKQRFFKENMEKVVKIQSVVRAKIQGQAYKSLTAGKNPPVNTLKGFVHLLNDSDFDFDEEIEFERLRKLVVSHVRQNEMADQYIQQLDIKIALLVKNKITLDEVVKHQRHFGGHVGALLPNSEISSKDPFDLKALNKTSRRKLEHYQDLFFLLQTQPQYLARLFRRIREQNTPEKECESIKHVVMGLFGYAQKRREEYYLTKLIARSVKEEVESSMSLQEYVRTNAFCIKLFAAYVKSPRDRKYLRDAMGALVKEHFLDNPHLDLESDPMQIYLSSIKNEELRTGQRSQRNPNVPREVALRDEETRGAFIAHMETLRDITDHFLLCLEESLPRMPFGVRYIAQQTQEHLMARFPSEDPGFVLQLVGQWLWRNYLQPALLEPEKYGVADRAMTQEQKRNLSEVCKVLSQAVQGREFGVDNVYMQPLNNHVKEYVRRFGEIWNHGKSIVAPQLDCRLICVSHIHPASRRAL
jgi:Ras GTPase-activating-like protein IQGAP2/3